ncbi:MAG: ribosome maturation factor RimM [Proteobacteria bacterium]|nr:ribosome maturation factor RimM [Pseudomonadota bacterium]
MKSCSSQAVPDKAKIDMVNSALVIIGKIGGPYGVQGWQHIHSFANPIENILHYQQWYVEVKGVWQSWQLIKGRRHGQGIVALLNGIDSPEVAMQFRNSPIAIARSALEALPQDEFYWTDLEGMSVISIAGEQLGNVHYLYENSTVDVMVVKNQNKERHIPFIIHDTVLKVDCEHKQITVDWDSAL